MFCNKCSQEIADLNFEFCTNCGERFDDETETILVKPIQKTEQHIEPIMNLAQAFASTFGLVVVAVLVAGLIVGAVVLVNKDQEAKRRFTYNEPNSQADFEQPNKQPISVDNTAKKGAKEAVNKAIEMARNIDESPKPAANVTNQPANVAVNRPYQQIKKYEGDCEVIEPANLKRNCDIWNCDSDPLTVATKIERGASVKVRNAANISSANSYSWIPIFLRGGTGEPYFISSNKIDCS